MDRPTVEGQIVRADKRYRRLVLLTGAALSLVGLLALWWLWWYLGEIEALAAEDLRTGEQKALRVATVVVWVCGLSLVGMGGWFWRLGRRINLADRFPPPGMKVVKDTRIRTGAQARVLAGLSQATALVCVLAGTLGMWYLHRLAVIVLRP